MTTEHAISDNESIFENDNERPIDAALRLANVTLVGRWELSNAGHSKLVTTVRRTQYGKGNKLVNMYAVMQWDMLAQTLGAKSTWSENLAAQNNLLKAFRAI